jgi:hypothetical protein
MERTPDLSAYFAVHQRLRAEVELLAADPTPVRLARFTDELRRHHDAEARTYFAALRDRVPSADAVVAEVLAERRLIDALLDDCEACAPDERPILELRRLLMRQLDVEDEDLLPLFYRHFTASEFDALRAETTTRPQEDMS